MILGNAEQHKQLGQVPVGRAEFPEGTAKRVDTTGRHINRTETAMCREIRRAELLRPPASQRLRLIATGKKGQLFGIPFANRCQPVGGKLQGLFPTDRLKLTRTTRASTPHRTFQARWRIMLHNAGRSFGAKHPLIDRMITIPLDVANFAVAQMHIDAAATGAHVARRSFNFVTNFWRHVYKRCRTHRYFLKLIKLSLQHNALVRFRLFQDADSLIGAD